MALIEKDLRISLLFDFYGEMLTENQKEAIDFYYNQDLSLAEIAQHSGITRQGVRDAIKRAERQLLDCEGKLGLLERFREIQAGLDGIKQHVQVLREENRKLGASPVIELEAKQVLDLLETLDE